MDDLLKIIEFQYQFISWAGGVGFNLPRDVIEGCARMCVCVRLLNKGVQGFYATLLFQGRLKVTFQRLTDRYMAAYVSEYSLR